MPIETGMYAPQRQANPLEMLGQLSTIQQQIQQNKLLGQEVGARDATGKLYRDATGADGAVDFNRVLGGAAGAGYKAPEVAASAMQNQDAAQKLATSQANTVYNGFGALLSGDKPPTKADVQRYIADQVRLRRISPGVGATLTREIPPDPAALSDYLTTRYTSTLPAEVSTSPTQIGVKSTGETIYGTRGQFIGRSAGTGGAATNTPKGKGAGVTVTLPVGEPEALATAAQGSGQQLSTDRVAAGKYKESATPLEMAIPLLEKIGPTGQGVGSEEFNTLRNLAVSWGIAGAETMEKTKLFEEARKYLTQEARNSGSTATNDQLAAAFAGTPNMTMTNAAAIDLAKSALALRRMKAAQVLTFDEKEDLPPSKYATWSAKWSASQDPRAYGWDLMTPDQRKKVWDSIPAGKRDAFRATVEAAQSYGLLNNPGGSGGTR